MTDQELEQIRNIIHVDVADAVAAAMRNPENHCRFSGVNAEAAGELSHALGMLADIGEGSLSKGIERTRVSLNWLDEMRSKSSKASSAFFILCLTTIGGGIVLALWEGIKVLVKKAGP